MASESPPPGRVDARARRVGWRHALDQGPVLGAFMRVVLTDLVGRRGPLARLGAAREGSVPEGASGPWHQRAAPAPRPALVAAYLEHVGGDPGSRALPPHLFSHWCFPLIGRIVAPLPFPVGSAVNAGGSIFVRTPLPVGEPLEVRGRLAAVDADERRVLIRLEFVTSTPSARDGLESEVVLLVSRRPKSRDRGSSRPPDRVPEDATEVARFSVERGSGLAFAKLTGDFNPLHWVPPYARLWGFEGPILHGFETFARTFVGLEGHLGGPPAALSVRFLRPAVLPVRLGVYVRKREVYVARGPEESARLTGTFSPA